MRQLFLFTVLLALLAGCGKSGYRYTKSGMKYKIIDGGGKDTLKHGDMIKMSIEYKFEDSVLQSVSDVGYQLFPYDSNMTMQKYGFGEIMNQLKIGDSAVCVMKVDSIIRLQFGEKPPPGAVPAWMKKGKNIYNYIKIVQKYTDTAAFTAEKQKEAQKFMAFQQKMQEKAMAEQKQKDSVGFISARAELEKFLGDKKNTLIKTAGGSYVEITEPGTGMPCDSGKLVSVRYRGTLLNGEEFDSNILKPGDTLKRPAFQTVLGQNGTIPGFDEGLRKLRGGSKAKFYIPAEAGYGGMQQGPKIKPYSNLIFEIIVENVGTAPKQPGIMPPAPNNDPRTGGAPKDAPGHEGHNH